MKRSAFLLAVFCLALALAGPAPAAAKSCVHLVQRPGGQIMVNTCKTCRTIRLERHRPSSPAPVYRHYTLAPESKTQLTLRGTGRTRILSEEPCRSAEPGGPRPFEQPQQAEKPCVILSRKPDSGEPVLFNGCDRCQAVMAERIRPDGSREQEIRKVLPHSFIPFPAKGAVQARILRQQNCPE